MSLPAANRQVVQLMYPLVANLLVSRLVSLLVACLQVFQAADFLPVAHPWNLLVSRVMSPPAANRQVVQLMYPLAVNLLVSRLVSLLVTCRQVVHLTYLLVSQLVVRPAAHHRVVHPVSLRVVYLRVFSFLVSRLECQPAIYLRVVHPLDPSVVFPLLDPLRFLLAIIQQPGHREYPLPVFLLFGLLGSRLAVYRPLVHRIDPLVVCQLPDLLEYHRRMSLLHDPHSHPLQLHQLPLQKQLP